MCVCVCVCVCVCAVISAANNVCLIDGSLFPSKVSSRCPAITFAIKCTAIVPGRIKLLVVSMKTINNTNMVGVPWGTVCSSMWLVFLIHPNSINLIHRDRAKVIHIYIYIYTHMYLKKNSVALVR